jgi:hypothetical protein
MTKFGKTMSWDMDTWKDIVEYSTESEKDLNDAAEDLVKEGIVAWKNKKKK